MSYTKFNGLSLMLLTQFGQTQSQLRKFIILLLKKMKKKNSEVQAYINAQINVFIEPLVYNLVLNRPTNPVQFAIQWLFKYEKKKALKTGHYISSDEESDAQLNDQVRQLELKIKKLRFDPLHRANRSGISEEVFGLFNCRNDFDVYTQIRLEEDEQKLVRNLIKNSRLFQNFDQQDDDAILRAVKTQQNEEYDLIIKEGETGQNFYIVASGQYDCYKKIEDQNIFVKTYSKGEAFGELSLLYNAPRAASIVTKVPGKLLILDRSVFSKMIKVAAFRKQTIIESALEKVEILSIVPKQRIYNIIGAMKEERFEQEDYVLKQGQCGEKFYIVIQGELQAEKLTLEGEKKTVYKYQEGSYFGELALLNNEPRQASIKALRKCKLMSISRQGFNRVFGNLQQKLKQISNSYHQ